MDLENRVVVLIDMDCFYCQVEEKLNPELKGQPIAVVQYNPWKGGGIIAVNYVARAMGVTRHMRGDEAKEKCPEIQLPSVPCQRGKADISKYREAGKDVAKVLQQYTPLLERASIDEAYLDITALVQERLKKTKISEISTALLPNTFALGYDSINDFVTDVQSAGNDSIDFDYGNAKRLLMGAIIVSEIRAAVFEETGYQCSAGISHNKILAKLVCGMNKPNKQTVLPKHSINILYKTLPIRKVKHLGGKFGQAVCDALRIQNMAELLQFSEKELQMRFDEKNGTWLYNIARGTDLDPVQARFNPKSIGCCKQLRGKSALTDIDSLKKWLKDLGDEIEDRLEKDALETNRIPRQMVVSYSTGLADGKDVSSSRSYNFMPDDELCADLFSAKAFELVMESAEGCRLKDCESNRKLKAPIKFLGISVGKFEDNTDKKSKKIMDYFAAGSAKVNAKSTINKKIKKENEIEQINIINNKNNKCKEGKEYILHKFLKVGELSSTKTNTADDEHIDEQINAAVNDKEVPRSENKNIEIFPNKNTEANNNIQTIEMVTALDKQESFFAKFLLSKADNQIAGPSGSSKKSVRPITPICKVVTGGGDDSNETEYSGSTINDEINKSIALFEDDPGDILRVSNMRTLLQGTKLKTEDETEISEQQSKRNTPEIKVPEKQFLVEVQTFDCSECGKTLPLASFETHADYHLALELRDEERELARKEINQNKEAKTRTEESNSKEKDTKSRIQDTKRKKEKKENKNKSVSSITSFFVKLDDSIPTKVCAECGKKIQVEKFAEHLDFHEAQKLNRKINNKPMSSIFSSNSNSTKRKRKSTSPLKKPKMPCTSIDSFIVNR